jgi:Zn-finger nucleic acid-binding protein
MCPHCHEPLIAFELEGVEIDRCIACGGTWLDTGELEQIAWLAGVDPGPFQRGLDEGRRGDRTDRRCPRCNRPLRLHTVGEGDGAVELDRCPAGDGFWLDRGEMAAVIRRFETGEGGAVSRFFAELYRSEIESDTQGGR